MFIPLKFINTCSESVLYESKEKPCLWILTLLTSYTIYIQILEFFDGLKKGFTNMVKGGGVNYTYVYPNQKVDSNTIKKRKRRQKGRENGDKDEGKLKTKVK